MMRLALAGISLLVLGCASATRSGPTYSYAPVDAPLRYGVTSAQVFSVETPMGNQVSRDTLEATVALAIGGATSGGRSVSATFEALRSHASGDMGSRRADGGDLVGRRLSGTLRPSGRIDLAARPSLPADLAESFDPMAFFADLLAPMPPDGTAESGWPIRIEVAFQSAMRGTGVYEGTARLAGDTTWSGRPAKIILVEGTFRLHGTGTPSGAPGELDMTLTGTTTRRYLWDPARGIMLRGHTLDRGSGSIEVKGMGLTLPAKAEWEQTAELKR